MIPALDAAPTDVVAGNAERIVVNGDGSTSATGLFAAVDVTHVRDGFVSAAIAEGVRAGIAASVFLQRLASRQRRLAESSNMNVGFKPTEVVRCRGHRYPSPRRWPGGRTRFYGPEISEPSMPIRAPNWRAWRDPG
jgi:hypothetical protein